MNVSSSGENELSCDALTLTSEIYQGPPFTSKYNFALLISSALKFVLLFVFCNKELSADTFIMFCCICIVVGEPFTDDSFEPLRNTFRYSPP